MTIEEAGKVLRRYWTDACGMCALKQDCTPSKQRRVARWETEAVLDRVQARDTTMIMRRSTAELPSAPSRPGWARLATCYRDGPARARLQHQAGDRHPRSPEIAASNLGMGAALRLSRSTNSRVRRSHTTSYKA